MFKPKKMFKKKYTYKIVNKKHLKINIPQLGIIWF